MTAKNRIKSFITIIPAALLLVISCSITAQSRVSPAANTFTDVFQQLDIRVIKDAGLQFELPKGWKAENQTNGNIFLTFDDGRGNVTFVIADEYKEVVAAMKDGLKERLTEFKFDDTPKENDHNGMVHISETGTGQMEGLKIIWRIDVLKANKNVTLLTFGIDSVLQGHIDEYKQFVGSIKKIKG